MKKTVRLLLAFMLLVMTEMRAENVSDLFSNSDGVNVGVEVGYVNKQFRTRFDDSHVLHENTLGDEGAYLHGLQVGVYYQPILFYGLGLKLGLYWEQYFASGRNMGYESFREGNIYLPLDAVFRIPISRNVSVNLIGGISMNYIVYGQLSSGSRYDYDRYNDYNNFLYDIISGFVGDGYNRFESEYVNYGEDGWPQRFNGQYEFGISFRINAFTLKAMYSIGLTNHKFYWNQHQRYETHERKLAIGVGFAF